MSSARRTSMLAWLLFALWAATTCTTLGFGALQGANSDSIVVLLTAVYAGAGTLVAARRPHNAVGWLLLAIAATAALHICGQTYVAPLDNPGYVGVAWVTAWLANVWLALIMVFLLLIFPTGRVLSSRWRIAWWFAVVTLVTSIVMTALEPGELDAGVQVENPLAVNGPARTVLSAVDGWVLAASGLSVLLAVASNIVRLRRSTGVERQQLKWFASAVLLTVGSFILTLIALALPPRWSDKLDNLFWTIFLLGAVVGIPLAAGIAILRYRLYDIDLVINRTLVYGSLTAALVATYVASTLLLGAVLTPIAGESELAVAGSTLAVAAVFRPVRAWIQAQVDRRFYRRRYDAMVTLDEFSTRLRHEFDTQTVEADLRATAEQTMQPEHVSLWLRARDR